MRRCFALVPRDGFFCKDGRDWFTAGFGRGHGLEWPWPSTILGALRTAWGRATEDRHGLIFTAADWVSRTAVVQIERTVALRRPIDAAWTAQHIMWPRPLDAIWFEGDAYVLGLDPRRPTLPTLGRDDDPAREALWRPLPDRVQKPSPLAPWWPSREMIVWLAGEKLAAPVRGHAPSRRFQVHVGIRSEELTADEGILFSHDVTETLERSTEWAIGVEVTMAEGIMPTIGGIGSDARPFAMQPISPDLFAPPEAVLKAFRNGSPGLRLVVVTPACFEQGWLPDGLRERQGEYRGSLLNVGEVILRAAIVPRPVHVSGWDRAAGKPKPVARMVAPGSVFFFERADGRPFDEADARALWLGAIGERRDEGFGCVVPGVWNPTTV